MSLKNGWSLCGTKTVTVGGLVKSNVTVCIYTHLIWKYCVENYVIKIYIYFFKHTQKNNKGKSVWERQESSRLWTEPNDLDPRKEPDSPSLTSADRNVTRKSCATSDGGVSTEGGERQRGLLSFAFSSRCYQMVRARLHWECASYVCKHLYTFILHSVWKKWFRGVAEHTDDLLAKANMATSQLEM